MITEGWEELLVAAKMILEKQVLSHVHRRGSEVKIK
jgi:hypothetical protein